MYKQMDLRTGACAAKNPSIASTAITINSDNGQLTKCVLCAVQRETLSTTNILFWIISQAHWIGPIILSILQIRRTSQG